VLGGAGYTTLHAVERYWRDARLTKIFEARRRSSSASSPITCSASPGGREMLPDAALFRIGMLMIVATGVIQVVAQLVSAA